MEDMGFFCVDNLPIPLLEKFVELSSLQSAKLQKVAVGIDIRSGQALGEMQEILERIRAKGAAYEILFLDAEDSVLVKRYKETRRNHPLSGGERVDKGIEEERSRLKFLKEQADYIIDTSQLLTRELKIELEKFLYRIRTIRICLLPYYLLDSSMEFQMILTWFLTCVSCRTLTMWKDFVRRQEMTKRFRIM